ncbi:MAG: 16S rRNA (uracil(1498)-N(3))-methyltransferase [Paludibacter sp.]
MSLFYVPNLISAQVLPEEESLHAVKVLRLQSGDAITVVDGVGGYYEAQITRPHPKHCEFEIVKSIAGFGKRDYKLHIAIAPTKNIERLEWFIEKATEIGIDEITPLICRFSERKVIKADRLEKIIVSAAKQSVKAYFPKLNPLCTFDELLKSHKASQKFIAHCYTSPPTPLPEERGAVNPVDEVLFSDKKLLQNEIQKSSDILILIGPEGDFSKEEVQKAIKAGFVPVSLGDSRLRTETAGVVACCTVAFTEVRSKR